MENQQYPMWKHSLMYGLYLGVVLIILSLVFYILDLHGESWTGYISYIFILGGVILGSVTYRDKHLNGFITYGQSFSAGFLTGLFAAIIGAIFTYFFIQYLGEEFVELMLEKAESDILARDPEIGDAELDLALSWTEKMMNPTWISLIAFLGSTFFSLIFALIASIFIKKENDSVELTD
jgi:hypothetical protein